MTAEELARFEEGDRVQRKNTELTGTVLGYSKKYGRLIIDWDGTSDTMAFFVSPEQLDLLGIKVGRKSPLFDEEKV